MSTQTPGGGFDRDFESLARQYWSAWGDSMRGGSGAAARSDTAHWQDAIDAWSKLAHGDRAEANAAVERFNAQARNWYGQMQQVAAQFAGQDAKAADITAQWKRALNAIGEHPFPDMFKAMRGQGAQGGSSGPSRLRPTWRPGVAKAGRCWACRRSASGASNRSAGSTWPRRSWIRNSMTTPTTR